MRLFGFDESQSSELISVALSRAEMDQSCNFDFHIYKEETEWLFNAECFLPTSDTEIVVASVRITAEETETLFSLLNPKCKRKKRRLFHARDLGTTSLCLTFADGSRLTDEGEQTKVAAFFFALAKKYYSTTSDNDIDI